MKLFVRSVEWIDNFTYDVKLLPVIADIISRAKRLYFCFKTF